ncbi:FtsX-like permease family protein [Kitasatospora sp. NPDC096147]|uniref:FtsX-like permease family protein n=1 Tax=Kitasatospora sp. NPDC096147 TaxID=3364093 RepID=UPI0037F87326
MTTAPTNPTPPKPGRLRAPAQLALGARLALGSGREGWGRLALTAAGVALGVALLLFTASFPGIIDHRNQRLYLQNDTFGDDGITAPTDRSVLLANADSTFDASPVRGRVVQREGAAAVPPPGLAAFPEPGRMAVSPALARLLAEPGSELLRERLPYPVTGTIGPAGLLGPGQYAFALGSDTLSVDGGALRVEQYGHFAPPKEMDSRLVLLNTVGLIVMLAPVGVFLAAAARFGGERRDRRLAALRLAGADRRMTSWFAAGESLIGSLFGVALGALLFLSGRQLAEHVTVAGFSFYAGDISPQPAIGLAVALAVPALAVLVTLGAMRRIAVDPLGVVRRTGRERRRIWWRLALAFLGLLVTAAAMLMPAPAAPGYTPSDDLLNPVHDTFGSLLVAFGVLLMLLAVCTLLPWLVEAIIRRAHGGPLSWQLAVRRLQLGSGPAATAVSGVVVTVAGAIALQTLFFGVSGAYAVRQPADAFAYQHEVAFPGGAERSRELAERLGRSTGVARTVGFTEFPLYGPPGREWDGGEVRIADCAALAEFATLPSCRDGDAFLTGPTGVGRDGAGSALEPGAKVRAMTFHGDGRAPEWTVPAITATVPSRPGVNPDDVHRPGGILLLTPGATPAGVLRGQPATVLVAMDPAVADPKARLTTDAMVISPLATTGHPLWLDQDSTYLAVKRVLTAGAGLTLLLVAVSLLVGQLERLREQRRILGVLYAFGTRRRVLAASVLWQTAIPMALGLALAALGGLGMGALLQYTVGMEFLMDWGSMLALTGCAAGAVLLVTAAGLPAVIRLVRPSALRHE